MAASKTRRVLCYQVIDDFVAIHGRKWRAITADSTAAAALLEPALVEYQVLQIPFGSSGA